MSGSEILERIADVLEQRRRDKPAGSYVASLLEDGHVAIAAKLREETEELIEATGVARADAATTAGQAAHIAHEAADLFFHALVLLCHAGVPARSVFEELDRRFGTGGLTEKASRREPRGDD